MENIVSTSSNRLERIWLLAKIEFKLRYYENKLGLLWALIKPISQLLIYFVAFKIILRNDTPNYAIYLFSGIIMWQFYTEATGGLINILKTKKYLYEYSNMSKIEIYLASIISISLGFLFNFLILLVFLIFSDIGLSIYIIYLPILLAILITFTLGLSMILSNIFIIAKDINQVWPLLSMFLMWLSPIFLKTEDLERSIPFIKVLNPMFGMIKNFRAIVMYQTHPDFTLLLINLVHALIALALGLFLLKKIGGRASEIL
jgi:ABC-type polysaccharide/polyol phosphate export permease